jgi:hypothetical protein
MDLGKRTPYFYWCDQVEVIEPKFFIIGNGQHLDLDNLQVALRDLAKQPKVDLQVNFGQNDQRTELLWQAWGDLVSKLTDMDIVGLQVLDSAFTWDIFDYFGDMGGDGGRRISLFSWLQEGAENIERFIEKSHYIENLIFKTSCPSWELIDGFDRAQWEQRLKLFLTHGRVRAVQVYWNVNELTLSQSQPFLTWYLEMAKNYRPGFFELHPSCLAGRKELWDCFDKKELERLQGFLRAHQDQWSSRDWSTLRQFYSL